MTPELRQHWFLAGQTLDAGEIPATIGTLSLAQRRALKLCLAGDRLDDRGREGWQHPSGSHSVDSRTVLTLAADGFLVITRKSRFRTHARLTTRGNWYARTLVTEIVDDARRATEQERFA